jgi:hypothetical protein
MSDKTLRYGIIQRYKEKQSEINSKIFHDIYIHIKYTQTLPDSIKIILKNISEILNKKKELDFDDFKNRRQTFYIWKDYYNKLIKDDASTNLTKGESLLLAYEIKYSDVLFIDRNNEKYRNFFRDKNYKEFVKLRRSTIIDLAKDGIDYIGNFEEVKEVPYIFRLIDEYYTNLKNFYERIIKQIPSDIGYLRDQLDDPIWDSIGIQFIIKYSTNPITKKGYELDDKLNMSDDEFIMFMKYGRMIIMRDNCIEFISSYSELVYYFKYEKNTLEYHKILLSILDIFTSDIQKILENFESYNSVGNITFLLHNRFLRNFKEFKDNDKITLKVKVLNKDTCILFKNDINNPICNHPIQFKKLLQIAVNKSKSDYLCPECNKITK